MRGICVKVSDALHGAAKCAAHRAEQSLSEYVKAALRAAIDRDAVAKERYRAHQYSTGRDLLNGPD